MNYREESLRKHAEWRGKIETKVRVPVDSRDNLSLAYTPGVAEPCLAISGDVEKSFTLTRRWNTVPVITDGTAVLGLGDIGPEAGMPVMEGKCALFKEFGGVDAVPICIRSKDTDEIVRTIELVAGSFGGINLEDISAPRCFEIERRLKEDLDIPVFHDDQHGTAVVTYAALINALKITGRKIEDLKVVINGAGSAGLAIAKFLLRCGALDVTVCDRAGIICEDDEKLTAPKAEVAKVTNRSHLKGGLADAMRGADLFIGVSAPKCVTPDMVKSMQKDPILFTCANPVPEILPDEAKAAGAYIVGTGSSEYPNQINNVLCFPGLFRGALDVRASDINFEMLVAAAKGIASGAGEKLSRDFLLPHAYDKEVHRKVAAAVSEAAIASGVARTDLRA
ncbi:MAG: NADP-dependent malic enzyme [Clostridia bacterium]|nr:NADP-dependent malic enzyme [Clostridia bacterium]